MPSTTVRVSTRTRDALTRLSRERGVSTADLLDELVSRQEQDDLLAQMNAAYASQREDPKAWRAELAERELWERAALDGLSDI